jgi:UDP-glucose:(heptosyl)LPS alpha-1,3-glucosyltransferase
MGAAAEKYCMNRETTRRIIAVSEQVKSDIVREYGVDARKVVVIHHGVDQDSFHPRHRPRFRVQERTRLGLRQSDFLVLFVGGDYRRKGLERLIDAVAHVHSNVRILAVGVRPDRHLTQLVRARGLHEVVTFLPSTNDMMPLYAAADCFALPTLYDTFSLATLEAMAVGLPVIVSRAAGVSEVLTHNHDSLILDEASDVEMLGQYLRQLMADEMLRNSLGAQARDTAERNSWEKAVARTVGLYRESMVLAGSS